RRHRFDLLVQEGRSSRHSMTVKGTDAPSPSAHARVREAKRQPAYARLSAAMSICFIPSTAAQHEPKRDRPPTALARAAVMAGSKAEPGGARRGRPGAQRLPPPPASPTPGYR